MLASKAILRGDRGRILQFNRLEQPLALQVGGSSPKELAAVARIAEEYGYQEINLNLGCPSKKVQKSKFGACLMKESNLVGECINQMVNACKIPVTAKTRIGYDNTDDYENLKKFISVINAAGSSTFIIHARKAILTKFTPKQNLNIPPLNYDFVYKIKKDFQNCNVILNGGIKSIDEINYHLKKVNGVMIGRSIYHSPYFLAEIEKKIFKNDNIPTRSEVMEKMIPYIQDQIKRGTRINQIMRHTIGLFHGQNGSKSWKNYLSTHMCIRNADLQKINHIMDYVKSNNLNISSGI